MKANLLGFLFGESQVREEMDAQIEDDLKKLFERADAEDLTTRKSPLTDALSSIGISGDVQEDPEGFCINFEDGDKYRSAINLLAEPDNLHKLAELGWVATKCGDQAMSNEPADFKIRFLEITTVATGSSDKAPSMEKVRKDANKENSTKLDRKDDDLNPVEVKDYTSTDNQKGVADAKDGADPEGKPKGASKSESLTETLLAEGGHKAGCTCGFCKNKGSFGKKKKDDEAPKGEESDKGAESGDMPQSSDADWLDDSATSIVTNLLDSETVDEAKKKTGKGKVVAKQPGKITYESELADPPLTEMTTVGAIPPLEAPMAVNGSPRAKPDYKERLRRLKMRRDPDGIEK